MEKFGKIIAGALVCVGLCVVGVCVGGGLRSFSNRERVVTVKGLAEKLIKATEAKIWVNTSFSGDVPSELTVRMDSRVGELKKYLAEKGYAVKVGELNINDSRTYYSQEWYGPRYIQVKKDRYYASQGITVTIGEVENAEGAGRAISADLIAKSWSANSDVSVSYVFPELNEIKPELIAESTRNARLAGEQFANDSNSKLGKIKTASQGQITIAGRYSYDEEAANYSSAPQEAYYQKARVVSTIVFYLQD